MGFKHVVPTHQEMNGGKTISEIVKEMFLLEELKREKRD
jgi:hypothetical protein